MRIEKISLRGIKNALSRAEMKEIMAGLSGGTCKSDACGDGSHACADGYRCTKIDCISDSGTTDAYPDCVA